MSYVIPAQWTPDGWLIAQSNSRELRLLSGREISTLTTVSQGLRSFAYRALPETVFYCGSDGHLYNHDVASATEQEIPLPESMSCAGSRLVYREDTGSLVFSYTHNSLGGLAEYLDP